MLIHYQVFKNTQPTEKLFLSKRTVDNHRTNILKKAKSRNSTEHVRFIKEIVLM